jgi:hypothetical protein
MFIRRAFVTNSSSCSFIAWGQKINGTNLDKYLEGMSWDDRDNFWERIYDEKEPIIMKHADGTNCTYLMITESYLGNLEDAGYVEFDPSVSEEWQAIIKEWCEKFGEQYKNPRWFFATVGC